MSKRMFAVTVQLLFLFCVVSMAWAVDFVRVSEPGFGNIDNRYAWSMCVFAPEKGPDAGRTFLYVGTWKRNRNVGADLWRMDIQTAQWEPVVTDGFKNKNNHGIRTLIVFENQYGKALYAGTFNNGLGAEVWRSFDGRNWEIVNVPRFGAPSLVSNQSVRGAAVIDGDLYMSTSNGAWIPPEPAYLYRFREKRDYRGRLKKAASWQAVISPVDPVIQGNITIAHIFRYTDRYGKSLIYVTTWNAVTGAQILVSDSGDPFTWRAVMKDGFGKGTVGILSVAEFKGYLYIGTGDREIGFNLFRSDNPTDSDSWRQIGEEGFGYGPVSRYAWQLVSKEGRLFLGTYNPPKKSDTGAFLYESDNGLNWTQIVGPEATAVMAGGFNDSLNPGIRTSAVVNGVLYLGTSTRPFLYGSEHGCEIWKMID